MGVGMERSLAAVVAALWFAGCAVEDEPRSEEDVAPAAGGKADSAVRALVWTGASNVEALGGAATDPFGFLGHYGPIGEYGPLGVLGAAGLGGFDVNGALTAAGPLGVAGPLGDGRWRQRELDPGGAWSVVGPIGPLGALGPLGPLGPSGPHGLRRDGQGRYLDAGGVRRSIEVPWRDGEVRSWPLVELYPEHAARAMEDHDTSFVVTGELGRPGDRDELTAHSAEAQWVTVAVIPEHALYAYAQAMAILAAAPLYPFDPGSFDDLDLEVEVAGHQAISSTSGDLIDWLSVRVPAGAALRVRVGLHQAWSRPWRPYRPRYRLIVVGSTHYLDDAPAGGAHQVPLDD
jgi:hypothetical protein